MKALNTKLLAFRKDMESIKKDSDNPFFKSKYADLPSILAEIKDNLVANGLSITHRMKFEETVLVMETIVSDTTSGEEISSVFPVFGSKPQEIGSAMTYARRYNLQALLDLSTEDDDGNSANGNGSNSTKAISIDDNRPYFNDPQYALLEANKDKYEDAQTALKIARSKYKVSKEMQARIESLYK